MIVPLLKLEILSKVYSQYICQSERKEYQIDVKNIENNSSQFVFIDKISKGKDILYDKNELLITKYKGYSYTQQIYYLRKEQMEMISKIIKQQYGIDILYEGTCYQFECKKIIDNHGNAIDLNEFLKKYYHFSDVMKLVSKTNNLTN